MPSSDPEFETKALEEIGDCGPAPLEGHDPEVELDRDAARDKWNHGYVTEARSDSAALLEHIPKLTWENQGRVAAAKRLNHRVLERT